MPATRRAALPPRLASAEPGQGVTLADVALAAKVSLATASRVFSHPQLVREATAQRVHEAAQRLSFRPNLLGAKLRAQRTRIIGVMLPTLDNAVFAECWRGIEESAMAGDDLTRSLVDLRTLRDRTVAALRDLQAETRLSA